MYRGFIKDITNLAGQSLGSPELRILNLSINRDILSKATSEFEVINIPDAAQEGNVFGVYDDYGTTVYLGVINSINGNVIQCDQIISIFNDNWLWSDPKAATIEETLVQIIQNDFQTNRDEMVKTIFSQFDIVAGTTSVALQLPTQDENYVVNFMQFIFELYESYEILFDINISFNEVRPTITIFKPSFNTIKLGNNTNAVRNFDITTETFETNKIVVYSKDGETFRGEWYGTTSGITQDSTDLNRLPKINTKFIFSDDEDGDIVGEYLAEEMYNHKINVELVLGNKLYDFDTFKLGQVFDIFYNDKYYNSVLTGYKIQVDNEGKADVATLVFGKVRYSLENKLYKLTMNNNASSSSGGGQPQPSSTKFVKGTPINLYDTDGTTILSSKNPENLVFYDGESGDEIANNFMFATLPSIYALTTSFTSPSWQQVKKGGSGFEISNGSIKCNKNGKVRVIVSGMLSRASSSVADMEQRICLNGVYVEGTTISITQAWTGNATSVGILDVREGDLINVLVKTSVTSANYLGASQMICEYIEDYYITRTTTVPDLQAVYPVGSIYMSVNNTNPYELFGFGTWTQIKDTFLLGAGDTYNAGATGGEAEHTLTTNELPSHTHRYGQYKGNAGWSGDSPQPNFMKNTGNDGYSTTNTNGYMETLSSGGGQAHNNMPPYLVVYMWQRVS